MASSSSIPVPSSTSTAPPGPTNSNNPDGDSPTSRPLLFFVALGFGVVFTNLWIIVGVKYCFRYNRQRQNQLHDANGEPIDLNNAQRPRRKREKKLMTMDEVNERFPLTKYKIWRSSREANNLPAAGGITAPPSRAASIREHNDLKRVSTEIPATLDGQNDQRTSGDSAESKRDSGAHERKSQDQAPKKSTDIKRPSVQLNEHYAKPNTDPETPAAGEEDDDPIEQAGVPTEYANTPGDTCAICIDTLEDEDDVRGLSCGHAFHAGCLDPWLTSRRACCPLCKADFYVPKPRNNENAATDGTLPQPPEPVHHQPRISVGGSNYLVNYHNRYGFPSFTRDRPARPAETTNTNITNNEEQAEQSQQPPQSRFNQWRSRMPAPRLPFRRAQPPSASDGDTAQATPGQLEAGTR